MTIALPAMADPQDSGALPVPQFGVPALVPLPVEFLPKPGHFTLRSDTPVQVGLKDSSRRRRALETFRRAMALPLVAGGDRVTMGTVRIEIDHGLQERFGREGYRLQVTPEAIHIQTSTEVGVFYAGITLRQMLPAEAFRTEPRNRLVGSWDIPCAEIEDYPRFGWRGLLVDPARHFLPVDFLKRFIDLMALHKLNTLQIHLTDDVGWRLEIKKYPQLTKIGSFRKESPQHGDASKGDGSPYGPFFYTQREMRDLVAYAQARNITIVPEIEMPGHFIGALAAYPQFSCNGGPFEVKTRWGVQSDILCPGNDQSIEFARNVLAEVVSVFPSKFIHIGGDEAPRDRWKTCPKCQARMKAQGLVKEAQLQTWFNSRIEEFLSSKGRRMIGWDEILEGGLTPGATVMSWRGMEGGITAAKSGHDVVMAPTTHCYFDYAQSQDAGEPESIGGFIPLEKVYGFEPVPPGLPADKQHHVLGAQGALWGEFLWNGRDVEYFAFPRAAALAEVLWSPANSRDFAQFKHRLQGHLQRLETLGVNYRHEGGKTP